MKAYSGRRVRIYERGTGYGEMVDTGKSGRLLEIDMHRERVMIENEDGELIKLFYKLVKLI